MKSLLRIFKIYISFIPYVSYTTSYDLKETANFRTGRSTADATIKILELILFGE